MGNITILNEKGRLSEQGIVIPLYLLLLTWPVLVIFHNNVMFFGCCYNIIIMDL